MRPRNICQESFIKKKRKIKSGKKDLNQDHEKTIKRKKKVALEPATFKKLVTNDLFVDKTLFIKDVLNCSSDHMLITRPRRWGKTLNMDMLKTLLEIEMDTKKEGIKKRKDNQNYFNGENTKKNQLKIWSDPHIDTRIITEFLLQSDENNQFVLPKTMK